MARPDIPSCSELFANRGDDWSMTRRQRKAEFGVEDFSQEYNIATLDTGEARVIEYKTVTEHNRRAAIQQEMAKRAEAQKPMSIDDRLRDLSRRKLNMFNAAKRGDLGW
jgi:hypothetical protein